jgi:hypothetical protein
MRPWKVASPILVFRFYFNRCTQRDRNGDAHALQVHLKQFLARPVADYDVGSRFSFESQNFGSFHADTTHPSFRMPTTMSVM